MDIIPSIDLMREKVVRLVRGDPKAPTIYSHAPVDVARRWEAAGADALHVVDLDATLGNDHHHTKTICAMARALTIPVQVGGGIRTVEKAEQVLSSGVSRAVMGTMAFQNRPALLQTLRRFGQERIMVALDYAEGRVMIKGWRESTDAAPLDALRQLLQLGVRQFLMTSVAHDGVLGGVDLEFLTTAAQIEGAEIYASGGVSSTEDLIQLKPAGIRGAILGKALYEGKLTVEAARAAISATN